MRADFFIYKSLYAGKTTWRARFFWDETTGKYLMSRNLDIPVEGKKERRKEAEAKARALLEELCAERPAIPPPAGIGRFQST